MIPFIISTHSVSWLLLLPPLTFLDMSLYSWQFSFLVHYMYVSQGMVLVFLLLFTAPGQKDSL